MAFSVVDWPTLVFASGLLAAVVLCTAVLGGCTSMGSTQSPDVISSTAPPPSGVKRWDYRDFIYWRTGEALMSLVHDTVRRKGQVVSDGRTIDVEVLLDGLDTAWSWSAAGDTYQIHLDVDGTAKYLIFPAGTTRTKPDSLYRCARGR